MTSTTTEREEQQTTPRVYLACLASYNAGILHGLWADATDEDALREAVTAMLAESPTVNRPGFAGGRFI